MLLGWSDQVRLDRSCKQQHSLTQECSEGMGWKSPHPLCTRLSMSAARPIGLILLDLITLITFSRRSEDRSINRRRILKCLIRNSDERCYWIDSGYGQMEDSYKHSNELLGFNRCRNSWLVDDLLLIRKAAASWKDMSVLTDTRNWTQSWVSFLTAKITNLLICLNNIPNTTKPLNNQCINQSITSIFL
jgi:hypothetical protein